MENLLMTYETRKVSNCYVLVKLKLFGNFLFERYVSDCDLNLMQRSNIKLSTAMVTKMWWKDIFLRKLKK